jgi:uncharacterized protein
LVFGQTPDTEIRVNHSTVVLGHTTHHQVVFVGPFGVGKSTALRAVSDIPVVNTDVASQEIDARALVEGKTTTTAGFDYGEWRFSDGTRVALMGVPGQTRFEAMWDILLPRSSAIVLWLFGDRDPERTECRRWLEALARRKALSRLAVTVTRFEASNDDTLLDPWRELVSEYHPLAPVMTADPRRASDVMQAITMALASPYAPIHRW